MYTDTKSSQNPSNEDKVLATTGIFVEIGSVPNSGFVKGLVKLTPSNNIVVDARNQRASNPDGTTTEGIWAAGDVTDGLYHQNNIAAGDAVKALEDIYLWLHKNS